VTSALSVPSAPLPTPGRESWPTAPPPDAAPLPGDLEAWLAAAGPELVGLRRHLHAHPELSHQEFATAELICRELSSAGLTPRLLPRGNGVICDIGGSGGSGTGTGGSDSDRVIALRADLDALPLPDAKDVEYRSTVPGATHACGHDVHTTILLGVGKALSRLADAGELPGPVRLLFQPAEETMPSGAPQVISAGGLAGVAAIFGLHCAPQLATGTVGVRSGPLTAAADKVEITVTGPGGHTARPHLTVDLVHALGRLIVDLPALLDRRVDPRHGISVVFGAVRAGEAPNAIPTNGSVQGTVRVLDRDVWRTAPDLIKSLAADVLSGTGARVDVDYTRGVPPVVNDRMAAAVIAAAAGTALGPGRVVEAELSMGGEDFAFYLDHVPGALVRLGTRIDGAEPMDIHQASFDVDESAISYGVRVMVHTALAALATSAL
jgi:amidohydrolase